MIALLEQSNNNNNTKKCFSGNLLSVLLKKALQKYHIVIAVITDFS